jgi:protein-S-isoprenylcysteine O-methyltransferase Ste14
LEKQGNWLFKHRSYLPLSVLVIGGILYLRKEVDPEAFILTRSPYEIYYEMFALCISLTGLLIRVYTIGFTPENTSGRNTHQGQIADVLNTTGMYSIVRHPLYLGNFLMWFGLAILTGYLWFIIAFILFYWLYYERIMYAEEQFLRKKFGERYIDWSQNVPAFLPEFQKFTKPDLPFNWKKVLKKEKNGVFALFLVFSAFDISGEIIQKVNDYNYFFFGMSILTGVFYIVVKYLMKKTDLLNELNT